MLFQIFFILYCFVFASINKAAVNGSVTNSKYDDNAIPQIKGPYKANKESRYLELVLVVDSETYKKFDSDVTNVKKYCKNIVNAVNTLYAPLNIFIVLTNVNVWTEKNEIELSGNSDIVLSNFLMYRKNNLSLYNSNDNAYLLTQKILPDYVIGKAMKGTMCSSDFSGGILNDSNEYTPNVLAHLIGHNFGMEHDDSSCTCSEEECIMNPFAKSYIPTKWSSCSLTQLNNSFNHGIDHCLRNKPKVLFETSSCGNGFVEDGEECDCGSVETCDGNNCCDPKSCTLYPNATCGTGECCDLETCKPKIAGTLCREIQNECDLPEYCIGQSEYCPYDLFKINGHFCKNGDAYCYNGSCTTKEDRCKLLWGSTGKDANDLCYNFNTHGTRRGNCGYDIMSNTYRKCLENDKFCGRLHCQHLNDQLEYGLESTSILSTSLVFSNGSIHSCKAAVIDMGLHESDLGLVPNGVKCSEDKVCIDQRCVTVDVLQSLNENNCPSNCSGHGICNSLGNCHCEDGFAPPLCNNPGMGGSVNSGPSTILLF